jgi:hypothetical protein
VRGTHQGGLQPVGASGEGRAMAWFKLQPLAMVGGGELQGMAHDKVGQNGCGAGRRTPASG